MVAPLAGRTVVVTRAAEQASALVSRLVQAGAEVVEVPTIAVLDAPDAGAALADAVDGIDRYDWAVLTSTNGAARFLAAGGDRVGGRVRIAVVGPGTADALRSGGLEPDLVPDRFVAEGLLDAFAPGPGRVLLAQAEAARPVLADGLRTRGWAVDTVVAYRTAPGNPSAEVLARARHADAITFTSGSTVDGYIAIAGRDAVPPVVVCIGPVTGVAAERAGVAVTAVATEHTIAGLVSTLAEVLAPHGEF